MRFGGWIFLVTSWGVILGLFVYSMVRILRQKDNKAKNSEVK